MLKKYKDAAKVTALKLKIIKYMVLPKFSVLAELLINKSKYNYVFFINTAIFNRYDNPTNKYIIIS